ncbi:intraflagellar transport protein 46 homolog [Aegotheles albertisi]
MAFPAFVQTAAANSTCGGGRRAPPPARPLRLGLRPPAPLLRRPHGSPSAAPPPGASRSARPRAGSAPPPPGSLPASSLPQRPARPRQAAGPRSGRAASPRAAAGPARSAPGPRRQQGPALPCRRRPWAVLGARARRPVPAGAPQDGGAEPRPQPEAAPRTARGGAATPTRQGAAPGERGARVAMATAAGRRALETRLAENQPYDESLELPEAEEAGGAAGRSGGAHAPGRPRGSRRPGLPGAGGDAADRSSDEDGGGKEEATARSAPATAPSEDDDDDSEEEDSSETDSEDDSEKDGAALDGDFNLTDYDYLPVSSEIKELFEYIKRYTPKTIEIEPKLQPFIPDFIPAVGDIDAFLKVPRPDSKPDNLGLLVLDEPSTKQSDPTVLSLWLTENSKQHNIAQQIKVKSVENAEKNPKAIESWIESISELHHCKPPATVHYTRPMPDIESLMQEWSPEFEELLGKVGLPTAEMSCDLTEYIDLICAILDIPVYKSRIQPLHILFSLYLEFKNSQHFKPLADEKTGRRSPSNPPSQAADAEVLTFT